MSTLLLRSVMIFVSRTCPESETLISVSGMMLKSKLVRKLYLWLPELEAGGYYGIFQGMMKEFGFKYVVSTLRESLSATRNGWKALIYNGKEFYQSKHYDINPIIDRVGGGDSFSGGLIHGLKPRQS
jgi:hypothetical protein